MWADRARAGPGHDRLSSTFRRRNRMRFTRWITTAICLITALSPLPVRCQDLGTETRKSPKDILVAVPGGAWAVLCVPKVAKLDRELMSFTQRLQLPMMVSPVAMAKMMTGLRIGFDDNGGFAAALLPTSNLGAIAQSVVIFLPTVDFEAMLEPMALQPAEGGMSKLYFMDQESYAAPFGKFAALAQNQETLSKALKATTSFRDVLDEGRLARIRKDDITLWVNLKAITSSDLFAAFEPMLMMLRMDTKMIREFTDASLSVSLKQAGVNLGMHIAADPASEMGRAMSLAGTTTESLLTGLPKDPFVVAFGSMMSEAAAKQAADSVDQMIEKQSAQAGDMKDLLNEMRPVIGNLIRHTRHVSFSAGALPEGADGMIAVTMVVTTDDESKRVCDSVEKALDTMKSTLAETPEAAEWLNIFKFSRNAETVGNVKVDHLKITLPEDPDIEKITKVLGTDGILVRLAVVDDQRVAITLGGGAARMRQVIEVVKSKKAPLADDEGLKHVAPNVPRERSQEIYFSVDRLVKLIESIAKATDNESPIPVSLPELNAPVVMVVAPSGKAGAQHEVFLPMELIRAVKDAAGAQMMAPRARAQPATPPGQQAPPTDGAPGKTQIVRAGCATCIFKMEGVAGCKLAVEIHGKAYLVTGSGINDHGDAHASDGLCKTARKATVQGKIEGERFVATQFELQP